MTRNPSWPRFLSSPDPDGLNAIDRDRREWARDAYARTHEQPLPFNDGYGDGPFTIEDALAWAERLADETL